MPLLSPHEAELREGSGSAFLLAAVFVVIYMFVEAERREPDTGYVYS